MDNIFGLKAGGTYVTFFDGVDVSEPFSPDPDTTDARWCVLMEKAKLESEVAEKQNRLVELDNWLATNRGHEKPVVITNKFLTAFRAALKAKNADE